MVKFITSFIDAFYIKPLRFIPINTFRYAAIGGINVLLNMVLYWFCFHFVLRKEDTDFGLVVISAPVLSFLIASGITIFTGLTSAFWLTRSIAFKGSQLSKRTQLFRYFQVVLINIAINYFGIKLLVDVCEFYPSLSYASIQVVTISVSYLMQKFYTFKGHNKEI